MGIFLPLPKLAEEKKTKTGKNRTIRGFIVAINWNKKNGFFRPFKSDDPGEPGIFFSFKDIKRLSINPYHLRRVDWSKIVFSFKIKHFFNRKKK